MKILSHASAKKKAKRLLGFNRVSDFALLLVVSSDSMAEKGLNDVKLLHHTTN